MLEKHTIYRFFLVMYLILLFFFAVTVAPTRDVTHSISSVLSLQDEAAVFVIRKIGHAVAYGLLFWLLHYSIEPKAESRLKKALLATFLCACIDEGIQLFVPGRHGRILDIFIDMLGVAFILLMLEIAKQVNVDTKRL